MLIAVDLDDVLADTVSAVIEYHNHTFGTALQWNDFTSFNWEDVWGGSRQEAIDKFFRFTETPYFSNIQPLNGAREAIDSLKKQHALIIITSRQQEIKEQTLQWVEKYFPDAFQHIYVTNHPTYARSGKTQTKRDICIQLGVEVLIEDNLAYVQECVDSVNQIFLFDTPWNQGQLPIRTRRVHSWNQILSEGLLTDSVRNDE